MTALLTKDDPKVKTGAYVREGKTVYMVIGPEKDGNDGVTGYYEIENIVGQHCSGRTFVHSRVRRTAAEIAGLILVKVASVVPEYLDAQMSEHLKGAGIASDGQQNFGLQGKPK